MGVGILCPGEIRSRMMPNSNGHRRITGAEVAFNTSAMDLPLAEEYWEMKGSCRGGGTLSVDDLIHYHGRHRSPKTLSEDTVFERGHVYLVRLGCELDLRGMQIRGKATARSSIGRLDVLVRLLGRRCPEFDRLPEDTDGRLYVEVAPISFNLQVSPGTCLSQLRLYCGAEDLFTLTMDELRYESPFPVVDKQGQHLMPDEHSLRETTYPFSLDLTEDQGTGCCGFVAKKDPPKAIHPDRSGDYEPEQFWEPVGLEDDALLLDPDRLYILRSKERLRLPGHLAVECQAYTETLGEWRIEYAGFAHPWFGFSRDEGTPIIFEVRGHSVRTVVRDGLPLGKVSFRRMSQSADRPEAQQYDDQELKLSSCFKPWRS